MKQKFYKYHGAGNDFVLMDGRENTLQLTKKQIARICNRRLGIGADGFMSLEEDPAGTEFYMRYYNADGGEVAMCGNGGRCLSLFAHHLGIGDRSKTFNSLDGLHTAEILETQGNGGRIRLQMIDVDGYENRGGYLFLNTGVPHYVEFVDNVEEVDVLSRGRQIRNSESFVSQGGTNVNFVQVMPDGSIRVRTYERGVEDETYACGTGATAAAMATVIIYNSAANDFIVRTIGGALRVTFQRAGERGFRQVYLEGPAVKVFECELILDDFFRA